MTSVVGHLLAECIKGGNYTSVKVFVEMWTFDYFFVSSRLYLRVTPAERSRIRFCVTA